MGRIPSRKRCLRACLGILDGRQDQRWEVSGKESMLVWAGVPPDAPMHLLCLPQEVLQKAVLLPVCCIPYSARAGPHCPTAEPVR